MSETVKCPISCFILLFLFTFDIITNMFVLLACNSLTKGEGQSFAMIQSCLFSSH